MAAAAGSGKRMEGAAARLLTAFVLSRFARARLTESSEERSEHQIPRRGSRPSEDGSVLFPLLASLCPGVRLLLGGHRREFAKTPSHASGMSPGADTGEFVMAMKDSQRKGVDS